MQLREEFRLEREAGSFTVKIDQGTTALWLHDSQGHGVEYGEMFKKEKVMDKTISTIPKLQEFADNVKENTKINKVVVSVAINNLPKGTTQEKGKEESTDSVEDLMVKALGTLKLKFPNATIGVSQVILKESNVGVDLFNNTMERVCLESGGNMIYIKHYIFGRYFTDNVHIDSEGSHVFLNDIQKAFGYPLSRKTSEKPSESTHSKGGQGSVKQNNESRNRVPGYRFRPRNQQPTMMGPRGYNEFNSYGPMRGLEPRSGLVRGPRFEQGQFPGPRIFGQGNGTQGAGFYNRYSPLNQNY